MSIAWAVMWDGRSVLVSQNGRWVPMLVGPAGLAEIMSEMLAVVVTDRQEVWLV